MNNKVKPNQINSFNNLTFFPMTVPNTGCIAEGVLAGGFNIVVTGGNTGQQADGYQTFLVEISDRRGKFKDSPKIITKRNMDIDGLRITIEHHYRNQSRRRYTYRPGYRKQY